MGNRSDNFNRSGSLVGSTPSGGGSAWATNYLDFTLNGSVASQAGNPNVCAFLDSTDLTDAAVQITVAGATGTAVGVIGRYTDENNRILLWVDGSATTLYRVQSGSFNQIATAAAGRSSPMTLRLEISGSSIVGKVNGSTVVTATDSFNLTATRHGFYSHNEATGTFDDFSIASMASDTTAPVLTSPTGTATGQTTATIGATTDEGNGTLYGVATLTSTPPSVAQIKAGQNSSSAAAAFAGTTSVSSTGAKTISVTGLSAATGYYGHLVHTDAAGNNSNVVSSSQFTTDAPSLTAGTVSFVSSGSAGISVSAAAPTGGTGTLSYQWERNASGGSYSNLSGATSLSLTDATATSGTLYGYRCKQTKGSDTVTTGTVTAQVYTGGALTTGLARIMGG